MSKSREGEMAQRLVTSSLPVKPVTPRTWKQMQFEAAPVSVFENGIYQSQNGPRQNGEDQVDERDTIPSYKPLSARSTKSESPLLASSLASNSSRPVSRLGVQRGGAPVASKFVVPPLNLKALTTGENSTTTTAMVDNISLPSSGSNAIYLRNQGLPLSIPEGAAPSPAASAAFEISTTTNKASQPVSNTKFTLPLRTIHRSYSNEEGQDQQTQQNSSGGGNVPLMPERSSVLSNRPVSRLGRPLTSMGQIEASSSALSSSSSSSSSKTAISTRHSGLPNFTGAYRSSDHNELLIKASGWVERPQTSSGTETGNTTGAFPPKERPSVEATAVWVAASKSFVRTNNLRASFASNSNRPSSAAVAAKAASAIIPRLSNYAAARRFLLAPGPVNEPLRCRVERRKCGLLGTSMNYAMILEEGECMMLTAKRHRRANGAAAFDIYIAPPAGAPEDASICVAKLQASFLGTEYVLIGAGMEESGSITGPESSAVTYGFHDAADKKRNSNAARLGAGKGGEMGAIVYNPNIMGTKGPRKATVVLPKLVPSGDSAWELQPGVVDGALVARHRQGETSECIVLRNRPPRWNAALGAYCLHFGGRVTHASVKNIQLIANDDSERVLLQFGRVGDDSFTLDYQFPVTPLQAFAVALASLDPKLGCE